MCNSARHIWEREFKEFGQNLRKFGSSKKEFRFQALITTLVSCARALYVTLFVFKTTLAPDSFIKLSFVYFHSFSYNAYCSISVGNLAVCIFYIFFFLGPLKDTIHQISANFGERAENVTRTYPTV